MDEWRPKIIVILVMLIAGMGISAVGFWKKSQSPDAVAPVGPVASAPAELKKVTVYVSGAVAKPGVLTVPAGSRALEVIDLAGGTTVGANLDKVNLAQVVKDGQQINVPSVALVPALRQQAIALPDQNRPAMQSPPPAAAKVSINQGTAAELDRLPGVGMALAEQIVLYRQTKGPFRSLEELKLVPGIGEVKYQKLKDGITL